MARRARTLSDEVRSASGASGGGIYPAACADGLYVCSGAEVPAAFSGGAAPRLLVCLSRAPPPPTSSTTAPPLEGLVLARVPLGAPADILKIPGAALKKLFGRVDAARGEGGTAVIQCDSGRARSVFMAAAYLLHRGMAPRDALLAVARSRPGVDCPLGAVAMFDRVAEKVGALAAATPEPARAAAIPEPTAAAQSP